MNGSIRKALFIGDSITDAGRRTDPAGHLGAGYVRRISERARYESVPMVVVNRGIGGNRVIDLRARWKKDCLDEGCDILTVYIGINDTWRRYDSGNPLSAEDFRSAYDEILTTARARLRLERLVIMEPFLVPVTREQASWHEEDLDEKIAAVRALADAHRATLIRLDDVFTARALSDGPEHLVVDGVHPTAAGHRIIADEWWSAVGSQLAA